MTMYLEFVTAPGTPFAAAPRLPLSERPLNLGRAPESDVVLPDDTVSWHHATVWVERGLVRVRDRESTNGTWIDDVRLDREGEVEIGRVLRLGLNVRLRVGSTAPLPKAAAPGWRLEVLESGASLGIPPDGLRVGSGPGVDLGVVLDGVGAFGVRPVPEGAEIVTDGPPRRVAAGVAFEVGGLHFRVLPAAGPLVPTVGKLAATDRYRLRVSLDGPNGAEAVLEDPGAGLRHAVTAENRAVLLYFLANRLLEDRAARVPVEQQGWVGDVELATGVWGREAARLGPNNLNVLLHRVRREIEDAGFDPSFLERRGPAVRARLVFVQRG